MLLIPLQTLPNQSIVVTLGGQNCQINIYQKLYGLFLDLYVDNSAIIVGTICENLNRLVRSVYLGFIGDLFFNDNFTSFVASNQSGSLPPGSDPIYTGLGPNVPTTRFQFFYLEAGEV